MSWFTYLFFKLVAVVFRALVRLCFRGFATVPPTDVYRIPSREAGRTIKAHVYRSPSAPKPSPVLINFHGSGFLIPMHGSDGSFCRQISQETEYTVLDVQYRLAPEHPFPAALNDVEDVVNWVRTGPPSIDGEFDPSRLALSGFSAGGNLAMAASSTLFPRDAFRCVLGFYPPFDLNTPPSAKMAPDSTGKPIPPAVAWVFNASYIPAAVDARDPRISPYYNQPERFPDRILLVTAARDTLALEAESLAARIGQLPGREVVCQRMQGCSHAWDKTAQEGTVEGDAREKAYAMAVAMLSRV